VCVCAAMLLDDVFYLFTCVVSTKMQINLYYPFSHENCFLLDICLLCHPHFCFVFSLFCPLCPSINNVLIIGMTNRKDMIDDAVLRPGRLEVSIQLS